MIIGIGGPSRSGKSFLAAMLAEKLVDIKIIVSQDDMIVPLDKLPKVRGRIDWEHPASIDHRAVFRKVSPYSSSNEVAIVEGLFAFWDPELSGMMKKIFIEIPKGEFLRRKQTDTRWDDEPPWYLKHIWQSYLRYGRIMERPEDYILLDGRHEFPDAGSVIESLQIR